MPKGLVYFVKNPAFPHLFKIGRTTKKEVEERGLNASNVPEDFDTLIAVEVNDSDIVEKTLHNDFSQYRHETLSGRKTEFFYIGCVDHAIRTLVGTKGSIDITPEVLSIVQDQVEKADGNELFVDPNVTDWISWEEIRQLRKPDDKFITEQNSKHGWIKAINWYRMSIVRQAKKAGMWNDKKISKEWLIDTGWMERLMNIQWID